MGITLLFGTQELARRDLQVVGEPCSDNHVKSPPQKPIISPNNWPVVAASSDRSGHERAELFCLLSLAFSYALLV